MATSTPILLSKDSQAALIQFQIQCYTSYNWNYNIRNQMQAIDLQYYRENDLGAESIKARIANRIGDKSRFQDIIIPIVMPQVESAVVYQSSVFLTGNPLFGVAASPEYEDEALQLETLIANQALRGGWTRELMLFFRDGFKYNISALECVWDREVTAAFDTDLSFSTKEAKPKNIIWEGNCIRRWDMYNTFFDTRVHPAEMHKEGEFVGRTQLMSRIRLKKFISQLPDKRVDNIVAAFESGAGVISIAGSTGTQMSYFIPQINAKSLVAPTTILGTDWEAWAGLTPSGNRGIKYKNMYEVTTIYARILPSDFSIKVPEANTPQIWKFIIVNHQVVIYAERQTNAHNYLPVFFGQPLEDGLGYQTKSLADNVGPIQEITSALANSDIAARRRAISDRTLYDPSRITEANINSANPSAKIPVRPAAYGKPVADAVHAFPFRDDQAAIITQKISQYTALANVISGQNPVRQGQFVKGNKTQSEFDDVMSHANGRDQMTAIAYESQVFTPLKEVLKMNILQYQGGDSLYNPSKSQMVNIDPIALRKAVLEFKVSDGLTPTDKLMNEDVSMVALQQIGTSPAIEAAYNIGPLFSYLMKVKGAQISEFEKSPAQQAYEQAVQQYQQLVMQLYKQNPDQDPKKLPPNPLPQDYGYNPATSSAQDSNKSALPGAGTQPTSQAPAQGTPNANPVNAALTQATTPTTTPQGK